MFANVDLLRQNGVYVGSTFALTAFVVLLLVSVLLRLTRLFLRSKLLAHLQLSDEGLRGSVWRGFALFVTLLALLAGAVVIFATQRGIHVGSVLHGRIANMGPREWLDLSLAAIKPLSIVLLAFIASRLLIKILHLIRDRVQRSDALSAHQTRVLDALEHLRGAMSAALLFGTLILCAQLWGLPDSLRRVLASVAYVGVALYVSRFTVTVAHVAIDVVFELSSTLSSLQHPLRYLGRFRHLSTLTKRAADYFIYVGLATWTTELITPGTWAAQAGHTALRIIAIFYLSRVFIEVCLLFLNEFFLGSGDRNPAEQQQRQTLVPVAASLLRYLIYFMAVVMSLREAGLDPTPLLAGAGVAGIAVGLGAQSFVGDIVAGFFILFENLFLVGDLVEIGEVKGKVEEIGVRVTKIRDEEGILHILPNSEVRKISSHSSGYVNVIVDVPIPYGEDLTRVFDLFAKQMTTVRERHSEILGPTEIAIEEMRDSTLLLRSTTMVKPGTSEEMADIVRWAFWEAMTAARVSPPYSRHLLLPTPSTDSVTMSTVQKDVRAPRSDIQKMKAYNLYLALYVDNNGYLEKQDVDALARRLTEEQRPSLSAEAQSELQRTLRAYWREIARFVDRNEDGRINREEFLQFCASLSEDLAGPAGDAVTALAYVLFVTYDRNRNGTVSETEFVAFTRAHGLSDSVASAGFRLIDRDRNGHISKEEWVDFIRSVFVSRKLNDAAAVVFGPGCRDRVGS